MFLQYYGLREQPFGVTPDPRFLWSSASHREALASIVYGIETGRGFVALIAKPGMGKTTLLFKLMEQLRGSTRTAFLFQSQGSSREFFSNLTADLGLAPAEHDLSKLQRQLNEEVIRESQQGRRIVVIIDEAQNLEGPVLESVRMLSNFETTRDKLIHIVLSGQPQLADRLMQPELAQLRQRVSVIAHLEPLSPADVASYVHHRLSAAGYQGAELFTPEALNLLSDRSEGVPRNVNNICFHALSVAFACRKKQIDLEVMQEVLSDLNLRKVRARRTSGAQRSAYATTGNRVPRPRQTKRPDSLRNTRPGLHESYSTTPRHAREGFSGRLFWAAAVVTLLIWAGVFWDSASATSLRSGAAQVLSGVTPRIQKTVSNIKEALHPDSTDAESVPLEKVPSPIPAQKPSLNGSSTDGQTDQQGTIIQDSNEPDLSDSSQSNTKKDTGSSSQADARLEKVSNQSPSRRRGTSKSSRRAVGRYGDSASAIVTGKVVVQSDVPGGRISVNGKNDPGWVTPHILELPPGTYRIEVTKGGYSRWTELVQVHEGRKSWVMANLGAPRGLLVLRTDPPGMSVYIDGRFYGTGTVQAMLTAGKHTYRLIPPSGLEPVEGKFDLGAGCVLMKNVRWESSSSSLQKKIFVEGDDKLAFISRRIYS